MNDNQLLELVRSVIAVELEIPVGSLKDDASLRKCYGLDSVAAVNIAFALEEVLGVEIDLAAFASVDTLQDLRRALPLYKI